MAGRRDSRPVARPRSDASRHALQGARDLGLLDAERVTAVRAFVPIAPMLMSYQGAPVGDIRREVAAERGADLLVVGTRGSGGIRRLILGSTAEAILARASVDVLAVPPGD